MGSDNVIPAIVVARADEVDTRNACVLYTTHPVCGVYLEGAIWNSFMEREISHWSLIDGEGYACCPERYDPTEDSLSPGFRIVAIERGGWEELSEGTLELRQLLPNGGRILTYDEMTRMVGSRCIVHHDDQSQQSAPLRERFINPNYEVETIYSGKHAYHSHHEGYQNKLLQQSDERYRIGVELEIVAINRRTYDEIVNSSSNWFYMERDGSLPDLGIELITVPLGVEDARSAEFWRPLCEWLSSRAVSESQESTGLHVHIGRGALTSSDRAKNRMSLGKLLYFYHHIVLDGGRNEEFNAKLYGRRHGYHDPGGKTETGELALCMPQDTMDNNERARNILANAMLEKTGEARYFDINLQNSSTIEFRKGKGTLNADKIAAIVQYNETMLKYVQITPWGKLSYDGFIAMLPQSCLKIMGIN